MAISLASRRATNGMTYPASSDTEIWLFSQPPTPRQTRAALAVAMALLAGLGVSVPFIDTQLPRIDAFIPALEGAVILTDFITSILLFSQCWISHSRALLALASGYLFTALIVIPHVLTFPGAFSPSGLFGAGLQTTGWLYVFWHFGLPISMVVYARLKDEELKDRMPNATTQRAVGGSVAIVVGAVCSLTLLATAGERFLPTLFLDGVHVAPWGRYLLALNVLVSVAALALLSSQRRSVLDQWIMVVIVALIAELAINGLLISARLRSVGTSAAYLPLRLRRSFWLFFCKKR